MSVLVLLQGCPVDLMEEHTRDTALLVAARCGWVNIAELCLQLGAKNDPHPHFGKTALQVCIISICSLYVCKYVYVVSMGSDYHALCVAMFACWHCI